MRVRTNLSLFLKSFNLFDSSSLESGVCSQYKITDLCNVTEQLQVTRIESKKATKLFAVLIIIITCPCYVFKDIHLSGSE